MKMHLMGMCSPRAYTLYKKHTDNLVTHRVINKELIDQILNTIKLPEVSAAGRPRTNPVVLQRLNKNRAMHSLRKLAPTEKKKNLNRLCKYA